MLKRLFGRWLGAGRHDNDNAAILDDILAVGHGGPVMMEQSGIPMFGDRLRDMAVAGLVTIDACSDGLLITPTAATRPAPEWTVHSSTAGVSARSKRAGKFISEKNPLWLAHISDFRQAHGRTPTARELMQRFPEMSRSTAFEYVRTANARPRLVHSA